jgi:hypothetical protein
VRTPLVYGAGIAIANALVNLGFFFAGVHSNSERLAAMQWLGTTLVIATFSVGLTLAVRERRQTLPPEQEWGFARAFGAGVLTGLFATLLGIVPSYLYFAVINPGFSDVLAEMQHNALLDRGLSSVEVNRLMPIMAKFTGPAVLTASGTFIGFIWASLTALVVAFFLRGRAAAAKA